MLFFEFNICGLEMDRIIPKTTWYSRDWRSSFLKAEGVTGNPYGFFPDVREAWETFEQWKKTWLFRVYKGLNYPVMWGPSGWSSFLVLLICFFLVLAMSVKRHEEKLPNCARTDGLHHKAQALKVESWKSFFFSWLICWPSPQSRWSLKLLDSSRHFLNERIAG